MDTVDLRKAAECAGQGQIFRFWDELDDAGKKQLADQAAGLDFAELNELAADYVVKRPVTEIPEDLAPAPFFPAEPRNAEEKEYYARAFAAGEELLRAGRVCMLTVAGGQGTRLGFDGPKGTYPIGPVSGRSLFGYFAGTIKAAQEKYGKPITWYLMTSVINDGATRAFFKENNYFGLNPDNVVFFTQGSMPAFGQDGKLLLGAKDCLSFSPNGHGGTLLALRTSGALDRMEKENCDIISYFQVDNPLAPMTNPLFLGLHLLENSEMSAIMLPKTNPYEKLGNFCVSGGRTQIIEYSDLPAELAESRNEDGSLRFVAGSPAIHVISRDFVRRLTEGGRLQLPWHRADKKVPYVDANGNIMAPAEPNAVKLESFIFDALPLAEKTMILAGNREDMFAPTKNSTGVDSAESCREMLLERDARILESAGFPVRRADGCRIADIELAPEYVIRPELLGKFSGRTIADGMREVWE
ncbi:MAG: UDPGP type 1 family protein [Lentisphaeria bacterium]|nr:UDPGP type 1 family protein [Lentisphaeria bacterium]